MGRVVPLGELVNIREKLRREKKKVVFTNGCFDLIHRGHVEYLNKAKALGDVLFVGVNTDPSVRVNKGPHRPIVGENDRAFIVSNISPVDYVCLFEEKTPFNLIQALVPDILVKGADWKPSEIVGKDVVEKAGGTVATIDYVPDRSTTEIIHTIVDHFK